LFTSLFIIPHSRRYARNRGHSSGQKYSSETSAFEYAIPGAGATIDTGFIVVPAPTTYGVRKVKNFTIQMNAIGALNAGGTLAVHLQYCLVFVPEGLAFQGIHVTNAPNLTVSLYEPNQSVIAQEIFDSVNSLTFKTRLARNL
jgi:hypothetical protein